MICVPLLKFDPYCGFANVLPLALPESATARALNFFDSCSIGVLMCS